MCNIKNYLVEKLCSKFYCCQVHHVTKISISKNLPEGECIDIVHDNQEILISLQVLETLLARIK